MTDLPASLSRDDLLARIAAHPLGETPEEMRPRFAALIDGEARLCAGATVERSDTGLTVRPDGPISGLPLVWLHGGGYVFGAPETHLRAASYLAAAHGLAVTLPRYRLAPEHVWPAQLEDALAALPDDPFALMGDSAGGHLALNAALAGRRPVALVLCSPNTDRTGRSATRAAMEDADPMVDDEGDARLAAMCLGRLPDDHPQVSPLLADLSALPRTLIEVGTPEVLLDDARLLHARAVAAGVDARLEVTEGLLHMGQLWAPLWDEARTSLDRIGRFLAG